MAKQINTRIQLKIDSYANWTSETLGEGKGALLVLNRGEIGLCEIPTGSDQATTAPTVLFKVGDGTNAFKNLKWASALAADVYDWAKAATVVLEGEKIVFKTGDTVKHEIDLSSFATQAEVNTLLKDYYTKTEVDDKIATINSTNEGLVNRVEAVEGRVDTIEDTLEGYGDIVKHNVSEFATATQGEKADTAVQPADLDPYAKTADVNTAITNATADLATKTEAQGYADAKDDAIAEAKKAGTDAADALDAYKDEMATALADKQDNLTEAQLTAVNSGIDATKVAKYENFFSEAGAEGVMDTLTEIVEYIERDEQGAIDLAADIAENAAAIKAINNKLPDGTIADTDDVNAVQSALNEYVDLHENDYTNTQIDAAIKAVDDKVVALGDTYATDKELEDAIAAEVSRADDKYATQDALATAKQEAIDTAATDATNKADAAQSAAEATAANALATARIEISAEIDADVKAVADKVAALTTDDIEGGTETWLFNCGTSTTVVD